MDVNITIQVNVDRDFEKEFLKWLTCTQDTDPKRVKESILTGYFITEFGINAYYKKHFEQHENDEIRRLIEQVHQEKASMEKDLMTQLTQTREDNSNLRRQLDDMTRRLSEESNNIRESVQAYFEEKSMRESQLTKIEYDAKIREVQCALDICHRELVYVKEHGRQASEQCWEIELESLKKANNDLSSQVEYFKSLVVAKDEQLKDAFKNETKEKMIALEDIIKQKDAELNTLKTCNFVKGNTGEHLILSCLRENFPKCDIAHTGKQAHAGDIQVVDTRENTLILIESKYKQAIDKNDIEKFCRDVSEVSTRDDVVQCIGGIFVSLLTRNIPGKGDAHFEIIGNVPVMYVGFSSTNEFNVYFRKYVDMFNTLCKFYKSQGAKRSTLGEFLEELNFYFNLLVRNKTRIDEFKTTCIAKMNKFIVDVESDNRILLGRVEDMLRKNNSLVYTNTHYCENCGEAFSTKRMLTKHVKTCGST